MSEEEIEEYESEIQGASAEVPPEIEQLEGELLDAGFDPEDIEEALYDPAPRQRRRKTRRSKARMADPAPKRRRRRSKRKADMYDPAPKRRRGRRHSRKYDPAPKRRRRSVTRQARGVLAKIAPYVGPAVGIYTFYTAYQARLTALQGISAKNKDGTPVSSIFQAIMYDVNNFNSTEAMNRVTAQVVDYGLPLAAGYGVKKLNVAGKYSRIAGDVLIAYGAAKLTKTILDPPVNTAQPATRAVNYAQVQAANAASQAAQAANRARMMQPRNQNNMPVNVYAGV